MINDQNLEANRSSSKIRLRSGSDPFINSEKKNRDSVKINEKSVIFTEFAKKIICCDDYNEQMNFVKVYPYFKSDVNIVNLWMNLYSENHNSNIKNHVIKFILLLYKFTNVDYDEDISKIIILIKNYKEDMNNVNILEYIRKNKIKPKIKNSLIHTYEPVIFDLLEPNQIASELLRYTSKYYYKITPHELIYASFDNSDKTKYSFNLNKLIKYFNLISFWVPTEIIKSKNAKHQSIIYNKFIETANICYNSNNFHMLFALVSGLKNISITRLNFHVTEKIDTKTLDFLEKFMSSEKSYSLYRQKLDNTISLKETFIPFVGIMISDIKHILECDYYKDEKINNIMYQQIIKYIDTYLHNEFMPRYSIIPENFKINSATITILSDDELYEQSLKLKPKLDSHTGKRSISYSTIQVRPIVSIINSNANMSHDLIKIPTTSSKNLKDSIRLIKKINNKSYKDWSNLDVVYWIESIDLKQYCSIFSEHEIVGLDLDELTCEVLVTIFKIKKYGHVLRIRREIENLKKKPTIKHEKIHHEKINLED